MKEYVEYMKKYEGTQDLEEFQAFQQGGGISYADAYADADTIPGMAPSTEREDGSPAKSFDDVNGKPKALSSMVKPKAKSRSFIIQFSGSGRTQKYEQVNAC